MGNKWIPVEKELPPVDMIDIDGVHTVECLFTNRITTYHGYCNIRVDYNRDTCDNDALIEWRQFTDDESVVVSGITHWCRIPDLP